MLLSSYKFLRGNIFFKVFRYETHFQNLVSSMRNSTSVIKHSSQRSVIPTYAALYMFSFTRLFKDEDISEISVALNESKKLMENGNLSDARVLLQKSLKMADNDKDIFHIKEQLGHIANAMNEFEEAKELYLAVDEYLQKSGNHFLKLLHVRLKYAECLDKLQDTEKAEKILLDCYNALKPEVKKAIKHEENKEAETLLLYTKIVTGLALHYLQRNNMDNSLKYLKKAFKCCLIYPGEISEQAVIVLKDLGIICYQKGDLESAVEYLKKAVEIGKHLPSMEELSIVYVTLGNIYLIQGLVEQTSVLCDQALKNAKRHNYEEGKIQASECLKKIEGK